MLLEGEDSMVRWPPNGLDLTHFHDLVVLASEITPGLLAGAEPDTHQFYVTIVFNR